MKYLLLLSTLLFSGCIIPYSVRVPKCKGIVLSAESDIPMESVTVRIEGYPKTETKTDAKGNFETSSTSYMQVFSMPLGDRLYHYLLIVEAEGFEIARRLVTVFRQDEIQVEPVILKRKAEPVDSGNG